VIERAPLITAIAVSVVACRAREQSTQSSESPSPALTIVRWDGGRLLDVESSSEIFTSDDFEQRFVRELPAIIEACGSTPDKRWLNVHVIGDGTLSVTSYDRGPVTDCAVAEISKWKIPPTRKSNHFWIRLELTAR